MCLLISNWFCQFIMFDELKKLKIKNILYLGFHKKKMIKKEYDMENEFIYNHIL